MRRLGLYVSVAFKAPVLVMMCMGVEDKSPIGMLVLVGKGYGGKSLLDMIIRWQKYIVATPKGDIAYWLDENRLTELQMQTDYGGKIPNDFFTAQLLVGSGLLTPQYDTCVCENLCNCCYEN
eukprot:g13852.t1